MVGSLLACCVGAEEVFVDHFLNTNSDSTTDLVDVMVVAARKGSVGHSLLLIPTYPACHLR